MHPFLRSFGRAKATGALTLAAAAAFSAAFTAAGSRSASAIGRASAPSKDAVETRTSSLLAQMTLDEKIQLIGGNGFETRAIARLGIPAIKMTDGPLGVRWGRATAFPAPILIGSSFDPDLAREAAAAMAVEARALGRDMLLTPCIGLARHPFGGRNFESYGEDPYLNSRMAEAVVRGAQGEGVLTSAKHFVVNDQEHLRHTIDTRVERRALEELHFPMFRAAIAAGAWSVMASYNKINGTWASENGWLLNDVLKRTWGFQGFVVSDWWATHDGERAALAGLDLEMPSPDNFNSQLTAAVHAGRVPIEAIDDKARRVLRAIVGSGLIDAADDSRPPMSAVSSPAHLRLAERVAREGLVLLKNEGALPLDAGRIRTLALIGPGARRARMGAGGSSAVMATRSIAPLQAFAERLGAGVAIRAAEGAPMQGDFLGVPNGDWAPVEAGAPRGVKASYFSNPDVSGAPVGESVEPTMDFDWGWSAPHASLPGDGWSVRYEGVWIAPRDGAQSFVVRGSDNIRVWFDGDLVVDSWQSSPERRFAFDRAVVKGRAYRVRAEEARNADRKTFGLGYAEDNPDPVALLPEARAIMSDRETALDVRAGAGAGASSLSARRAFENRWSANAPPVLSQAGRRAEIERAVQLAASSDAAVIFVGLSSRLEGEGVDRSSFELPPGQDELVERVIAANPNAIVVVNAGNPVAMPWASRAKAILYAWYQGQEGSYAIADAVLGRANPSGKLPVSFPKRWQDSAAHGAYPEDAAGANAVSYKEGVYLGYRWHDAKGIEPLFPFGHGLSYTRFVYSGAKALAARASVWRPAVDVEFTLANAGATAGAEVAQIYVAPLSPSIDRPPQELKAFRKARLEPGASRTFRVRLDRDAFAHYDPADGQWKVDAGEYEIRIGSSSRDIRGTARVTLM